MSRHRNQHFAGPHGSAAASRDRADAAPWGDDPWARWLDAWAPRLLLFARQLVYDGPGPDPEDIVQEAVVRLWKSRGPDGNVPPDAALAFLTIRRTAIDQARREHRRRRREVAAAAAAGDWLVPAANHPEAPDVEERAAITEALRAVAPRFREVIVLKIWGELTFREIGRALEVSPHTAASRYRYGLQALRRRLAGGASPAQSTLPRSAGRVAITPLSSPK